MDRGLRDRSWQEEFRKGKLVDHTGSRAHLSMEVMARYRQEGTRSGDERQQEGRLRLEVMIVQTHRTQAPQYRDQEKNGTSEELQ